jgi:uncharacterized protein YjiS (DUF1127 family)
MTTSLTTLRLSSLDLGAVFQRLNRSLSDRATRHVAQHLSELDDYLLADIGITRSEIHEVLAAGRK